MTKEDLSKAIGEIDDRYITEALSARTEQRPGLRQKRAVRTGVVAAAVAGLFLLLAGAVLLVAPVLRTYFGDNASYVYEKNSQILNLSQTVDGWTMTLTDCIGDDQFLYIGTELTAPEGTILDADGGGAGGLGCKDIEAGFEPGYEFEDSRITVEDGAGRPMAWYFNQVPDENGSDNHLRFVLWVSCSTPLDGKSITLEISKLFHGGSPLDGTAEYDFDKTWTFHDVRMDLADQTIRLEPNVTVPVLDTTATLTKLTVSPLSVMAYFEGEGLIGQNQRYHNGYNLTDPTVVLYDQQGNVISMESKYAPFGSRGGDSDNEAGKLKIVQAYEGFIDLDDLGSVEVCGVSIPVG